MTNPQTALRIASGELIVGGLARVVGTLSSLPSDFLSQSENIPCDIVEVRLDELHNQTNWLDRCQAIEANGLPVILTIRLASEGGRWNQPDKDRTDLFSQALDNLSAVDVEYDSEIADSVSAMAKRVGKTCIVSYHNFKQTPSLDKLEGIISKAQTLASIVKISTMVQGEKDIETLRNILLKKWDVPVCVIGMGPNGTQTRISFATMGSCMTYGYLDKPSAPGQLPASALVQTLRTIMAKYNEDFVIRKQILECA